MSFRDGLPERPSTASIRIRTIPSNANPTPVVSTDSGPFGFGADAADAEFEFVRDEFTVEKLRALTGQVDLEDVYNLEIEVDTASQSIAHLGEVLPNLETLKLRNSRVESFRDLGTRLRNLKILWVTRCGISELDGIVALSGLQELYIAFNDVSDLSPLALHDKYVAVFFMQKCTRAWCADCCFRLVLHPHSHLLCLFVDAHACMQTSLC